MLEPDSSRSYYTRGQLSAPKFFDMKSAAPDDLRLKDDYKAFQRWLNGELGAREQESNAPLVLFVERKHKRRLRNLAELSGIARSGAAARSLDFSLSSLEGQPFPNQLDTFRRTRVLVAQYGSGGHNVLFLPPGGVLVLLLQPGWCDQAWAYGNQALLSGASVVAVCSEVVFGGDVERRSFRWTHRAWEQGPWATKDGDWDVDEGLMEKAMARAFELEGRGGGVVEVYKHVKDLGGGGGGGGRRRQGCICLTSRLLGVRGVRRGAS